jgi:glycosyltransferase involved in cell wall biosynthesis
VLNSIIVPAYNEEKGLPVVLEQLGKIIAPDTEIIVVDDGSSDKTTGVARQFPCKLISHQKNMGKGEAMKTGIANSQGENIIFIDADGTYPTAEIPIIITKLKEYDAVFTAREQYNIPLINLIGNNIIAGVIKIFSGFAGQDPLSGLYGIKKEVLEKIGIEASDFSIETEIVVKSAVMGFKITEIPIKYAQRLGESKLKPFKDGLKIFKLIFLLLTIYNPLLTFIVPGAIISLIGLIVFLLTLQGQFTISNNIILDLHAFIFGAMTLLVGFQIIIQGVILDLYAIRHKYKKQDKIANLLLGKFFRWLFLGGIIILIIGLIITIKETFIWVSSGFGPYFDTRKVIISLLFNLFGLQLIFSALLGRVFAREIRKTKE